MANALRNVLSDENVAKSFDLFFFHGLFQIHFGGLRFDSRLGEIACKY